MSLKSFYTNKRVLVTGITGFKGSWLGLWLDRLGAQVHGIGLVPHTDPALFEILGLDEKCHYTNIDIRDRNLLVDYVTQLQPEVVIHMAAQALVRRSYTAPMETIDTNVVGTANLLHGLEKTGYTQDRPCQVVVVTSDKCYENRETLQAYREGDSMGGHDIYSSSKGMAELLTSSWRRSFCTGDGSDRPAIRLATCRAGNVIGGGDWSQDRIVVDCVNALGRGESICVRNPLSCRPWQHVLEPLSGYLQVGAKLGGTTEESEIASSPWNFGPGLQSEKTVAELCDTIIRYWGSGEWEHISEAKPVHEARYLKLAIEKAWHYLKWYPVWGFDKTVKETVRWYREGAGCSHDSSRMVDLTLEQIDEYSRDAAAAGRPWAGTT